MSGAPEPVRELELRREKQCTVQRGEKCYPRAEFWTNPFQGMRRKLQAMTAPILAADVVATRSDRAPFVRGQPLAAPHAWL